MLISFLLCPAAFDAISIDSKAARQAAQTIFNDILECGIVVDYRRRETLGEVQACLERLPPALKQKLLILLDEIQKKHKVIVATPLDPNVSTQAQLIEQLRPDVAIVPKSSAAVVGVPESVEVGDYIDGRTRKKKELYRAPRTPAARLEATAVQSILGDFLKYAQTVWVLDKMLGRSTRNGHLARRYIDGLQFLTDCWKEHSVYASGTLEMIVVTVAGSTGARGGYVDAVEARRVITHALDALGVHVTLVLKDDAAGTFHARFIRAKGRCFKIDPGIDDLARVGQRCCRLLIDPPTDADGCMAGEIIRLPDL